LFLWTEEGAYENNQAIQNVYKKLYQS
jgi:hypothetical protein